MVKKLEFGKDSVVQLTGGGTRSVRINYAGKKEVEIEDRGVLRGTLVAPKAKVEFEKDSLLEGAVYAKKIYLDKGVRFQFHEPEPADQAPVAKIAELPPAVKDDTVTLNGSGSYDPEGDALTFNWEINKQPEGSTAQIANQDNASTTLVPDLAGMYEFRLTVYDAGGNSDSTTAAVYISAPTVSVPDLVDMPQLEAENQLAASSLVLGGGSGCRAPAGCAAQRYYHQSG